MSDQNRTLQCALEYADMGIRVIVVHGIYQGACTCGAPSCKAGKHPLSELYGSWPNAATCDPTVIRNWFEEYPHANLAIPAQANGLVVLDIDTARTFGYIFDRCPDDFSTWIELTGGGGYHVYYRQPDPPVPRNFRNPNIGAGIEVIARSYVVCCPSTHVSGAAYKWVEDHAPDEKSLMVMSAKLQAFLKEGLKNTTEDRPMGRETESTTSKPESAWVADMVSTYVDKAVSRSEEHRIRARMAFGLARQLQSAGVPMVTATRAVKEFALKVSRSLPKDHSFTSEEAAESVRNAYHMSPKEPPRRQGNGR